MGLKPAKVLCSRCQAPCSLADSVCPKCGGRVIKVCGKCSFELSAAKKYCDSCGEPQATATPMPYDTEKTPMPINFAKREDAPPAPQSAPPPKREEPKPPAPKQEAPKREEPKPRQEPPKPEARSGDEIPVYEPEEPRAPAKPFEGPKTMLRGIEPPKGKPPGKPADKKPEPQERPRAEPPSGDDAAERFRRAGKGGAAEREPSQTLIQRLERRIKEAAPSKASAIIPLVLLIVGGGLYGFWRMSKRTPDRLLLKSATAYLEALKAGRAQEAHGYLTQVSQLSVPAARFADIADKTAWNYSDLKVASITEGKALLTYKLTALGQTSEDSMRWVLEGKEWRRAYWWHLAYDIEAALANSDFEAALAAARAAQSLDSQDPAAAAYECEAAYAAGESDAAASSCAKALSMGAPDEFRLRSILAAVYRNSLGKTAEALKEYDILLKAPRLDPDTRCGLLLAQGDARYAVVDYPGALVSFRAAADACRIAEDQAYMARAAKVLGGQAGDEAVKALQNHHLSGDTATVLEWRRQAQSDLTKRLKTDARAYDETWEPKHLEGAAYEVLVKNRGQSVLSAVVDLWTHDVKVKLNVQ